jgi:hypothetical protein
VTQSAVDGCWGSEPSSRATYQLKFSLTQHFRQLPEGERKCPTQRRLLAEPVLVCEATRRDDEVQGTYSRLRTRPNVFLTESLYAKVRRDCRATNDRPLLSGSQPMSRSVPLWEYIRHRMGVFTSAKRRPGAWLRGRAHARLPGHSTAPSRYDHDPAGQIAANLCTGRSFAFTIRSKGETWEVMVVAIAGAGTVAGSATSKRLAQFSSAALI